MTHFAVSDEFFDGQTLRAAGTAGFGGADVLECIAIARRVKKHDLDGWHDEWLAAAEQALELGAVSASRGQTETARLAFLRACTYFRTAGTVFLSRPVDARLRTSIVRQREAFQLALQYSHFVSEEVRIPFEGTTLPGYFFAVANDGRQRATVILLNGYDGTVEETYFGNAKAALDRGYNVLAFDGPGQGSVLIEQNIPLRPDWENVVTPAVDWLSDKPGVDPTRLALIGWSLGGYLAPRAASREHRLAACISDSGFFDLFDLIVSSIPAPLRHEVPDGNKAAVATVEALMESLAKQPTKGWALRRGLYVNDAESPMDYIRKAKEYTLRGFADRITCPTLVCHGDDDDVAASAPLLYTALTCPKTLITFRASDGAGDHCELGARQQYLARSFAWLDELLDPSTSAS